MYYFAASQQINTPKLPASYKAFQTEERTLRVKEAKITIENFFHGDNFSSKGHHE